MEYLFIYLLQVAELIADVSGWTSYVSVVASILFLLGIAIKCDPLSKDDIDTKTVENITENLKMVVLVSLCLTLFLNLLPTKQTLLLLGGTYYGKKAAKAILADEKLQKVNTIINLKLDEVIKDLEKGNIK